MFYIIYYNVYYSLVSVAILYCILSILLLSTAFVYCLFYSERSIIMFRVLFSVGEMGTDRTQKMRWNNY
jgi:hypothetical protein